jgi:methionyl aminopeptidase
MPIVLKSPAQIPCMRKAGAVAAQVASTMTTAARPGVATAELDELAAREMLRAGAVSAIFDRSGGRGAAGAGGGAGFPGHTCISVNEEVLNGMPGPRVLGDGDIVSFDVSVVMGGWCASRAVTVGVGAVTPQKQRLIEVANESLSRAIALVQPMRKWSPVAREIQQQIESAGFQVVREFAGHGIGKQLFEEPLVFNHVEAATSRRDFPLRAGMTLTIEPILVAGGRAVMLLGDGWTVVTEDGQPGAHVRHTIAVTENGAEVLTGVG